MVKFGFFYKSASFESYDTFHFRLNTLYIYSSVSVTMFFAMVHSGLAGHEKGFKFALFKSYDAFSLT